MNRTSRTMTTTVKPLRLGSNASVKKQESNHSTLSKCRVDCGAAAHVFFLVPPRQPTAISTIIYIRVCTCHSAVCGVARLLPAEDNRSKAEHYLIGLRTCGLIEWNRAMRTRGRQGEARELPILHLDRCEPRAAHPDGYWARPIRLFSRVFFSRTFTPWLVVGLAHFSFVRFFAFSSLFVFSLFLFHISYFDCFLKFLNRIKIQIRTNFKVATNFKSGIFLNRNNFQIETNLKLKQFSN
jgi:hypothetical protein